jgi:hypothetical protein
MKLVTLLHLESRLRMTELYPYTPICLHEAKRDDFTNSLLNPFHTLKVYFS